MEAKELIKKVRKVEIRTRGLSKHIFSGEYHSAFKGRGIAFSEVREYSFGDDIRSIDWNVTARLNRPFVKVFEEERELSVIILVDLSNSGAFGTNNQFKKELILEICAVLAFSAMLNNDKVGVVFFTNKVEKFIPPKKGKSHILRIIHEIIDFKPTEKSTDLTEPLRFLYNAIKKRSIVFVISDFIAKDFSDSLKITSKKHDTVAIQIYDQRESELPNIGLLYAQDSETGNSTLINSSKKVVRENYKNWWAERQENLNSIFKKSNVDLIRIKTDEPYIAPLMNFFKKRGSRR
ncbi:MAG: DUF58 domain-containing protein [Ignavibacteria bacterium]|jgi:uncharacterized protein (DUF58 family)|nr:DUF58 domain-containing protein [Ignavibacteria bacterium]